MYADLWVRNTEGVKDSKWLKGLKAEFCIQLGEIEPKRPQNIPIVEQLQEVARV